VDARMLMNMLHVYRVPVIRIVVALFVVMGISASPVYAQDRNTDITNDFFPTPLFSAQEHKDIPSVFAGRSAKSLNFYNGMAYALQQTYAAGVPIDSILLILSIPIIATMVTFFRYVVGFPTLGIVLTMVLSLTFIAVGISLSLFLLLSLVITTLITRVLFRRIRIMQFAKVALSMLVISGSILGSLVLSLRFGIVSSGQISIFPVLLFLLLSERIVALQLERSMRDALTTTVITIILGVIGYGILSTPLIRNSLLMYPEILLLLIPLNVMIGRYYGLRITEYFRFMPHMRHAIK